MITIEYKIIYNKFIEHYKNNHICPWHTISELELAHIEQNLINSMDINDEYTFKYFINYIIKCLSGKIDAHTMYDKVSILPINFKLIEDTVYLNYPTNLKGSKLISINKVPIDNIISELEYVNTYGTEEHRKRNIEYSLFDEITLLGLPSLRNANKLDFELISMNGENISLSFPESKEELEMFDMMEYRYGKVGMISIIDNSLIYNHTSVHKRFETKINESINELKQIDLSNIDNIIIDIRGNNGGDSSLNQPLMDYLRTLSNKRIICLTDYRVFSGGRFALVELKKLGTITIGEGIGTPFNCFGNCNWKEIDGYYFSASQSYLNPLIDVYFHTKEEYKNNINEEILKPIYFKPDIEIIQTKEDYLNGIDTVLNYTLNEFSKIKHNNNLNL